MTEEQKKEVAVFRFGVIADFVNGGAVNRAQRGDLMREKSARKWKIPYSEKTRICKGTINRWIRRYTGSGGDLESLKPGERSDRMKCRAMDEDTCLALKRVKSSTPGITVPQLIDEMNRQNLVTTGIVLNNSTVYRFLHAENFMSPVAAKAEDRRKFEAQLPNDLWQSDVMHGPKVDVEGKMRKTCLIAIIDDHSRLIVYARFYLSEALASYLDALENALARRGLPRKLYVDNGAAFRSKHLEYITAQLAIALIHAKPYQPEGKGKIERWFKTVRSRFLPGIALTTLAGLNADLDRWLLEDYQQKKHSATGQTPFERFTSQMHCLRSAPANLKDYFRNVARRKVAKDRTITLNGRIYEAPVALIGKRIEVLCHESEPEKIEVKYKNQSFGTARPVDLAVNSRVKRDKNNNAQIHIHTPETGYQGGKLWSVKRRHDDE